MSKTIILANKRRINVTDKAYVYSVSGYKKGIFSIARKLVLEKYDGEGIVINEHFTEPAVKYKITDWMFNQIKDDLERMNDHHYLLIK